MIISPALASTNIAPLPKKSDASKLAEAATQFEALLIGQLLKSAKGPDGEGLMGSEDTTGSALIDMGEQQFAQALANNGGVGIAKMVIAKMEGYANR